MGARQSRRERRSAHASQAGAVEPSFLPGRCAEWGGWEEGWEGKEEEEGRVGGGKGEITRVTRGAQQGESTPKRGSVRGYEEYLPS